MAMKLIIAFLALLAVSCQSSSAQNEEFTKQSNGLIYNDTTIAQLRRIVDSLSLKFRQCNFTNSFYSVKQATGNYFSFSSKRKSIINDIKKGLTYDEIMKKYSPERDTTGLLITVSQYKDFKGNYVTSISSVNLSRGYGYSLELGDTSEIKHLLSSGNWLYKTDEDDIYGFYLTSDLISYQLPEKYVALINYSDCLVDTTTDILFENAGYGYSFVDENPINKRLEAQLKTIDDFIGYLNSYPGKPEEPVYKRNFSDKERKEYEKAGEKYWAELAKWEELRDKSIRENLSRDEKFTRLLNAAVDTSIKYCIRGAELEQYARDYLPSNKILDLKRTYRVVGSCSMDSRPRQQAQEIALLAAENTRWDIFLRSHLNIMNDRFERVSDGSYAWAGRSTYIKELEVLDINVLDLILGISLRVNNATKFHYYGSISRLGRALAETNYPEVTESRILEIIKDTTLDSYNRVLMYFLFSNYNYYVKDFERRVSNTEKLRQAIVTLPSYISEKIKIEKPEKGEE